MPGFVNHRARYKIGTFATARGGLPTAIMYMVYGFHFRKIFGKHFEGRK